MSILNALKTLAAGPQERALTTNSFYGGNTLEAILTDSGEGINLAPDAIWASQPAVRTVVSFRSRNVAQVPLHSFQMAAGGERERVRDTPLAELLRRPSPLCTPFEFMNNLMVDRDLWDRYAAVLRYNDENGWWLDRLPPRKWQFVRGFADQPQAIRIIEGGPDDEYGRTLSLEQCLWFDAYPSSARSPIECIKDILIEEGESAAARRDMWKNRARVEGIITRPADAPEWIEEAQEHFKTMWAEFRARGKRSGGTPVLEDGMTYQQFRVVSAVDAQQIESRKLSNRLVASFYHVQPTLIGDADNSNYSNAIAFREQLYGDTLATDFAQIQQAINQRVAPRVAMPGEFAEFNVREKLRMSFDKQAEHNKAALAGMPWQLIDEIRQLDNLPPLPNGEGQVLQIPINMQKPADESAEK